MTKFKTIWECRLDLVAHTMLVPDEHSPYNLEADMLPVKAARASFRSEDKTGKNPEADLKLMNFLAEEEHLGVFEHNTATFLIECPIFLARQIHRHRTFAYNEWSRRYTEQGIAFWVPDKWRKQSKDNKQASEGELKEWEGGYPNLLLAEQSKLALKNYETLLAIGISREQARAVLPQSLLTNFFMSGNLRNWCHFIKLRKHPSAQYEVRVIADRIERALRDLWPDAMQALLGKYEPLDGKQE